jgi:hypothetical protein
MTAEIMKELQKMDPVLVSYHLTIHEQIVLQRQRYWFKSNEVFIIQFGIALGAELECTPVTNGKH